MRLAIPLLALAGSLVWIGAARADAPTLTVSLGDKTQVYTAAELLARPDAATIAIPADVAYGAPMTFRAVPLLALVPAASDPALDTIEARASDGFVVAAPARADRQGCVRRQRRLGRGGGSGRARGPIFPASSKALVRSISCGSIRSARASGASSGRIRR